MKAYFQSDGVPLTCARVVTLLQEGEVWFAQEISSSTLAVSAMLPLPQRCPEIELSTRHKLGGEAQKGTSIPAQDVNFQVTEVVVQGSGIIQIAVVASNNTISVLHSRLNVQNIRQRRASPPELSENLIHNLIH